MKKLRSLLAVGCLALGAMSLQAAATIDFSNSSIAGGTVGVVGAGVGTQYLAGTGIVIANLSGALTPQNSGGPFFVSGSNLGSYGSLSFQTGTLASVSGGISTFNPGGFLQITGGIPGLGIADGTLLLDAINIQATFQTVAGVLNITLPFGPDVKDSALVSYYFGSEVPTWIFGGAIQSGNTGLVTSADITNTAAVIPEPASLLLLGTAMIGVAFVMRRRSKKLEIS